jgi:hypothetical protein
MLPKIKYVAAYQSQPVSAITHVALVSKIESHGDSGKYKLIFSQPAKPIGPIPFADAPMGFMQGPRYTSYVKLTNAKKISDLVS